MTETPIEALGDIDFRVNTHKDDTMKNVVVWKYDAKNKKANYAKDKYNESERKIEERRLRSEKEALITDEKLVSFVGEVPTPTEEE